MTWEKNGEILRVWAKSKAETETESETGLGIRMSMERTTHPAVNSHVRWNMKWETWLISIIKYSNRAREEESESEG